MPLVLTSEMPSIFAKSPRTEAAQLLHDIPGALNVTRVKSEFSADVSEVAGPVSDAHPRHRAILSAMKANNTRCMIDFS